MLTTETEPTKRDLLAALEDRGFRMTQPRLAIARYIERQGGAFTAEALCEALPSVGRATVYRTIKSLVDAGALCKLPMPDGPPRYSTAQIEHHHHTVCVECGRVGEFRDSTVERVLRSLRREVEGRVVGHRMEVFIVCDNCDEAKPLI